MGIISIMFYFVFMYNIGDIVVVIDPGESYTSYKKMYEWLNLKNKERNPSFKKETVAQVFAHRMHEVSSDTQCIAIIDADGNESVISHRGLRNATNEEIVKFCFSRNNSLNKQSGEIPTIKLKRFQINII